MQTGTSTQSPSTGTDTGRTYRGPFAIMTVLFFMWGFMTVFNDILIPRFKEAFTLDYFHAMLVQLAFFGAYFVGSLLYFIISAATGDPIARIGYKNGVIIGLLISAFGSAIFWPAGTLAPRSSEISPGDLPKIESLATRLSEQKDPVSVFVYQNISESTLQSLKQGGQSAQRALAQDLDKLIHGPVIYDEQRFAGVKLEPTTKELLELNQKEVAMVNKTADEERTAAATVLHLNRALLEDAYPGEVNKNLLAYWVFLVALFHRGHGFCDVANRRKSLCDHPWAGAHGLQPIESGAVFQFAGHNHRAAHWGLVDFSIFCEDGRAWRRIGQDSLPDFLHHFCDHGGGFFLHPLAARWRRQGGAGRGRA